MVPHNQPNSQLPRYRLPWRTLGSALWGALLLRPRSFARDARAAVAALDPPLEVLGASHIPPLSACLVACNHYNRPGFGAWWITLAISAAIAEHRAPSADHEVHWVMTAAWTFPNRELGHRPLTLVSRWAFDRVARAYGFATMPPMPPAPDELEARARAVLRALRLARRIAPGGGMIGLAPEGQDLPGRVGEPPEGAGRFIALLVEAGLPVFPAGIAETGGRLRVSFGPLFQPHVPERRAQQDRAVATQVMEAIARQVPAA